MLQKQISYAVIDKLTVFARIKCGESQTNLSHDGENGVPESVIHEWLRDKERLCDSVDMVHIYS